MPDVLQNVPISGVKKRFPRRFGRYVLEKSLSRGGMGEVILAIPRGANRHCVIKTIRGDLTGDQEFVGRFADEAKIMVRISHENIIRVFDAGKVGSDYYIAMEFVYGRDLGDVLDRAYERGEPMPTQLGLYVTSELMKGLDYAHNLTDERGRHMGLVHRDISPQNVLVGFDGSVKLIDFGLARTDVLPGRTQGALAVGKYGYMSPEQARHEGIDGRADIYSAGVMLFEVFTGDRLVDEQDQATLWSRVLNPKHRHPRSVIPSLPREIDELVMRAVRVKPGDRFQSAAEMRTFSDSIRSPDSCRDGMVRYLRYLYPKVDFQPPPVQSVAGLDLGEEKSVIFATSREGALSVFGRGDLPIEWTRQLDAHDVRQEIRRRQIIATSGGKREAWAETDLRELTAEIPQADAVLDTRLLDERTAADRPESGSEPLTQVTVLQPSVNTDPATEETQYARPAGLPMSEDELIEDTLQTAPMSRRTQLPRDEEMTVMMTAPPAPMLREPELPPTPAPDLTVATPKVTVTPKAHEKRPAHPVVRGPGVRIRKAPTDPSRQPPHRPQFAVHRQTVDAVPAVRSVPESTASVRARNSARNNFDRPTEEEPSSSGPASGLLLTGVIFFGIALMIVLLVMILAPP